MRHRWFCGMVTLLLGGCANVAVYRLGDTPSVRGYRPLDVSVLADANKNALQLPQSIDPTSVPSGNRAPDNLAFSREWRWNRGVGERKNQPPQLCLALSGGGMRSAAFSIGVLKALHERRILEKVDVISAVSGGSYALSWYYAQHHHAAARGRPLADAELFDETGEYIQHVLANTRIQTELDYVAAGVGGLLLAPVNLLANAAFGWHLNTSFAQHAYEHAIRATFHASRPDSLDDPTLYSLGGTIERAKLPFFVINATARIEDSVSHEGALTGNSTFELTPLQYGSDALGRYRHPDDPASGSKYRDIPSLTLGRAVALSGAAADTWRFVAGAAPTLASTALNYDTGLYLANPAIDPASRYVHKLIPAPFYFFHHYRRDVSGTHFYLTDGGFSDNLGLFSLVRRLCQTIIVVDAEHDPHYQFEGYRRIQAALDRELDVALTVPGIDAIDHLADHVVSPSGEQAVVRDSVKRDPHLGTLWKVYASRPVMTGEICCLPYAGHNDQRIGIVYVKLAAWGLPAFASVAKATDATKDEFVGVIGRECKTEYGDKPPPLSNQHERDLVDAYFRCIVAERRTKPRWLYPLETSAPFPQQPTTDQNMSPTQFRAYMGLGRRVVLDSQTPALGTITATD